MPPADDYIFGTDAVEIQRLAHQHRLWSDRCVAHWKRAGFTLGQTLLDLGCGPGFASWDLAEFVGPSGRIIAVERAERYAAHLRRELEARSPRPRASIDLQVSSAEEASLPPSSLDGAYARWVFTFIADLDPVLTKVHDALRPGAPLAILDYFNWKAVAWGPRADTLPLIRAAVLATYEDFESDAQVGQKLPGALVRNGFELAELRPLVQIARPTDALWQWPKVWLDSFLPTVIEHGHLDEDGFAAWRQEWDANTADPAGFLMTPPQIEIIARRV